MTGLLAISRAIDRLNAGFGYLAEYLVFIAVLVSAGNAVSRYAFNFTSNAALEAQWYMFAAIVMLGAAYTLRMNEHVRVDIVYAGLPARVRLAVDALGILLFLMPFTLYLVWLSWPFFWDSFRSGEMSGNPGGLIRWPAKLVLPLGFFLLFLQGVSELIKRIAALAGAIDLDARYDKPVQ